MAATHGISHKDKAERTLTSHVEKVAFLPKFYFHIGIIPQDVQGTP